MKIRKQPERKACRNGGGSSLVKSDRQLRSKRKQQIQPRSVSTSCSSSRPSQPRKANINLSTVVCAAESVEKTNQSGTMQQHRWTEAEELPVLQIFDAPDQRAAYLRHKTKFCNDVPNEVNSIFASQNPNGYAPLNGSVVKTKLRIFGDIYKGQSAATEEDIGNMPMVERYINLHGAIFIETEATSSSSRSGYSRKRKGEQLRSTSSRSGVTSNDHEEKVKAAVAFMKRNGCNFLEVGDYSKVLMDYPHLLIGFWAMEYYATRKDYLDAHVLKMEEDDAKDALNFLGRS